METEDDARRWSEASAMAAGIDDPVRRRSRRNRTFLVLVAVLVLSWVLGVALAIVLPRGTGRDDVPDTRAIAALTLAAVGFVAMIGGFIWANRTGRYVVRWRSIASPLTRRQRRVAQRAIAGRTRLDPDRTPYLLALAAQNRRTTEGITPLYGGILLLWSAEILLDPRPFVIPLFGVVVVLFVIAAVQVTIVYRRSGRFLAQHE